MIRQFIFFSILFSFISTTIYSQAFAVKGCTEFSGTVGLSIQSYNGKMAYSTFTVAPQVGHFVAKGLELNFSPALYLIDYSGSGNGGGGQLTQFLFLFSPAYNFHSKTKIFPFVEVTGGLSMATYEDEREDGKSYGGAAGIKSNFAGNVNLIFKLNYIKTKIKFDDDTETGENFSMAFGFSFFLSKQKESSKQ